MERLDTGLIAAQFRRSTSHRSRDARLAASDGQVLYCQVEIEQMDEPNHSNNPIEDAALTTTAFSRGEKLLRPWLAPKTIVVVLIVLAYCAGNIFIPAFLSSSNPLPESVSFFFVGALAAEVGLLAAGTAFTRSSIVVTFTCNSMIMVFACASYIAGLQFAHSGMPKEAALFLFAIGFGAFFLTTGCLLVIRWCWNIRFEMQSESTSESVQSVTEQSFSIRYIMLTTAAIALAICVVRWTIPDKSQGMPRMIFQLVAMCTLEVVESISFLIVCLQLVMNRTKRIRILSLVLVIATLAFFPFLNAALVQFFTREMLYKNLHLAYGYIVGFGFFLIVTFSLLRLVGFRLSRRQPTA